MRSVKNIYMHELTGLDVRLMEASDTGLVGIRGKVTLETKRMIHILTENGVKKIQKHGTVFRVALPDGYRDVIGDMVMVRPHDRTKRLWLKRKKWMSKGGMHIA